jgi:hypothetical protein
MARRKKPKVTAERWQILFHVLHSIAQVPAKDVAAAVGMLGEAEEDPTLKISAATIRRWRTANVNPRHDTMAKVLYLQGLAFTIVPYGEQITHNQKLPQGRPPIIKPKKGK